MSTPLLDAPATVPPCERALDSFADETIVRVLPPGYDGACWYAVLDIGPNGWPSDPDFSTGAGTEADAIRFCARKIRDDAAGIGRFAPHGILTGYDLHYRLAPYWADKEARASAAEGRTP